MADGARSLRLSKGYGRCPFDEAQDMLREPQATPSGWNISIFWSIKASSLPASPSRQHSTRGAQRLRKGCQGHGRLPILIGSFRCWS